MPAPAGAPDRGDLGPGAAPADVREPPKDWDTRAVEALENGWPGRDEELGRWLDELVRGEWWATLKSAVGRPVGVSLDPLALDTVSIDSAPARRMGLLLAARSLQLQKRGDYDAALQPLEMALTMTANLQSFANAHQLNVSLIAEHEALRLLGEWANGVGARPELLRRALASAQANDRGRTPVATALDVEFYRMLRTAPPRRRAEGMKNDFERSLVQFAGAVAWETERERRLMEIVREGYVHYAELDFRTAAATIGNRNRQSEGNLGQFIYWRYSGSPWLTEAPSVSLPELSLWYNVQTQLQGAIIRLALMLHQCDHGGLPESLDALAPEYLKTLPADPYTDGPFHYRISTGERIKMLHQVEEQKAYRDVPAGAAVVWSVGPDLNDDGGRIQETNTGYTPMVAGSDVLFIVPRISTP